MRGLFAVACQMLIEVMLARNKPAAAEQNQVLSVILARSVAPRHLQQSVLLPASQTSLMARDMRRNRHLGFHSCAELPREIIRI